MLTNRITKSAIIFFAALAAFGFGSTGQVQAFSVDVKNIYYSDYINSPGPRVVNNYSFSSGTINGNVITIHDNFVIKPSSETAVTAYALAPYPDPENAIAVTLTTGSAKATLQTATHGGIVLDTLPTQMGAGAPYVLTATNQWVMEVTLTNFTGTTDPAKAYRTQIGMGSMTAGPHPEFTATWIGGNLELQAQIYNDADAGSVVWPVAPQVYKVVIPGGTPTATLLTLRLVCNVAGREGKLDFEYRLGSVEAQWYELATYNIPSGSAFMSFPSLFPYIDLRVESEGFEDPFQVSSQHWKDNGADVYHAYPRVYDPGQNLYSAVTINSPGYLTTETPLTFYPAANQWLLLPPGTGEIVVLGNTPPTSPVVFNFTATKKSSETETVSKTITGYVTAFATILSPAGNVTNPTPTFSWTGISGATSYGVQVSDATSGNRIWNRYGIPSGTTSAVYNNDGTGQALVSGRTYNYEIVSNILTGGVNNESFAKGTFTYTGASTISFSGWVKTAEGTAISGATVNALNDAEPPLFAFTQTITDGSFTITGIPASTTFRLVVPTPASTTYVPVLSKFMNWNANIQALLPFVLFTQTQYATFSNPSGTGMILGRVALKNSPTSFLAGATVVAREWTPGNPPVLGATYETTYNSVTGSTGADGIYMVKNVPTGKIVQLVAALPNYTFEFNGAVIPVQTGFISEESFFATLANNLLINGSFSSNLIGWVVNPALQTGTPPWTPLLADGSGVNLHPDGFGFNGTILHQNLNLTGIAGKTFSLSIKLTNVYALSTGNTVALWLTYVDGNGALQRVKALNPANDIITTNTVVTGSFVVPPGAQKIVKIELAKEYYGEFHADDVVLWADGVTSNPLPSITSLSAPSGAYGTTLTISGANFGTIQGNVRIGGVLANIVSWSNTAIVVSIAVPIPSGPVLVTAGQVESNFSSQPFQVTSPYFTVNLLNTTGKVIKGQKAEFLLKSAFYNGFTTTNGIGLQLWGGDTSTLTDKATFTPVPIRGNGGVLLKIDTTALSAGTYQANIQAVNGGQIITIGTFSLQVVTVQQIKIYEMTGDPLQKQYITSKTVVKQGLITNINPEVIGSDGQIFADIDVITVTSSNPGVVGEYKRFWGYDFYAGANGQANLIASTPGGYSIQFPVKVDFPTTSYISAIGLTAPDGAPSLNPIYNDRTAAINWFAQGTTQLGWIGYDTSGMMNFQTDFLGKLNRSQDGLSATSTFNLLNLPTDIGTAILYAQTNDGAAKAVIPLTTVNAAGTGLLSFRIRSLDSSAFAEMFKVYFFGTDNLLKFVRDVYAMHIGVNPILVGNIPPGTYKILIAPGNTSVKPQWWPNAADISGATSVIFTAGQTADEIYFFADPQPTGATLTIAPASQAFATPAAATGSFAVTAAADMVWAPMSNTNWITTTSGFTGSGNGAVAFAVAANTAAELRTGTISIGDKIFTVTQPGTSTVLKGDIDGINGVNLADAVLALKVVAGITTTGIRANYPTSGADVNGDGKVGLAEIAYILQYLAGLRQ